LPILEDYLSRQEVATESRFLQEEDQTPESIIFDPVTLLALRSGVDVSTIHKLREGKRTHLFFDTADRLMSAMELNHLWYDNGYLNQAYMEVDLRDPEDINPGWRCINGCSPESRKVWGGKIVCGACVAARNRAYKEKKNYNAGRRVSA